MATPYEEGDPNSKLLFLGQAPSFIEIKKQQPLVGPAGEVFTQCLHSAGIVRRACYILNLWPYQVKTDRTGRIFCPEGEELANKNGLTAYGWDQAQETLAKIKASGANLVVPLGAQATEACVGENKPMLKWRGSILEGTDGIGKKKVIPTLHPAATIRGQYLWRYLIISDLEKAKRHKEYPELNLPKRDFILRPTLQQALDYMTRFPRQQMAVNPLTNNPMVATDLEVINHQVSCFCVCYEPHSAMVIPLHHANGDAYWTEEEEIQIWLAYEQLMADPTIDKINQNIIGFDSPFLAYQNNIMLRGFLGDTMIAQSIMYPEFRKGLDLITSLYTDEPYYKDEGKMWKGIGDDIETFWIYNGKDGCVAIESWIVLANDMINDGYVETYKMTADLADPLTYMTLKGFKADLERLGETRKRVEAEIAEKRAELARVAEWEFNPASPKQCQQYFYVTKGLKPYTSVKTGNVTTDDTAMSRIYRKTNLPEAKLVQEIRALEKLKGTYLDITFDKDGRLRCSWNPRGTWTGRLSSSQTIFGTGANMQNLHPEFREFLIADSDEEDDIL